MSSSSLVPMDPLRRQCAGKEPMIASRFPADYWYGLVAEQQRADRRVFCAFCVEHAVLCARTDLVVLDVPGTSRVHCCTSTRPRDVKDQFVRAHPFRVRCVPATGSAPLFVVPGTSTVLMPTHNKYRLDIRLDDDIVQTGYTLNDGFKLPFAFAVDSCTVDGRPVCLFDSPRTFVRKSVTPATVFEFVAPAASEIHLQLQLYKISWTVGQRDHDAVSYGSNVEPERVRCFLVDSHGNTDIAHDTFTVAGEPVAIAMQVECFQTDAARDTDNHRVALHRAGYDLYAARVARHTATAESQRAGLRAMEASLRATEAELADAKKRTEDMLAGTPYDAATLPLYRDM